MKTKAMILAAAALTIAMSSTAFAGTWKKGSDGNQDKWWYDNGDGTYAQNGWNWIDGNGDGKAECYYFDANGWLYVGTTTPDGCQVNDSGAWVENGTVQTREVETVPSGWFDKAGLKENLTQNVPGVYVVTCSDNRNMKTTGQVTVTDYQISDNVYPPKEGYVWKKVIAEIEFDDDNARAYGASFGISQMNRSENSSDAGDWYGEREFTVKLDGREYTDCKERNFVGLHWINGKLISTMQYECLVPAGFKDRYIAFFDGTLGGFSDEAGFGNAMKDALIYFLD